MRMPRGPREKPTIKNPAYIMWVLSYDNISIWITIPNKFYFSVSYINYSLENVIFFMPRKNEFI